MFTNAGAMAPVHDNDGRDPDRPHRHAARQLRSSTDEVARALTAYQPVLQRAAVRILGCCDAARDAVQEALITLWLHPPVHGQERGWLVRTVLHRSLHERRTRNRRQRWEGAAVDANDNEFRICSPLHEMEQREIGSILEAALRKLPESYRTAFVLRELEGWDYERIACQLGIPVGTVRSRLNRARTALRAHVTALRDLG